MLIREIRPDECTRLGEITVEAFRAVNGGHSLGPYEEQLRDVTTRSAQCEVLVALDGDVVIGGVTFVPHAGTDYSEFDDPDAVGIRMLAIAPASQGLGAGHALTMACIDRGRARGAGTVLLHTTRVMEIARGMYERLGFIRNHDRDVWFDEAHDPDAPPELWGYELSLKD